MHIEGLDEVDEDACYRAMDWLHDVRKRLEVAVFNQVATLFDLEEDRFRVGTRRGRAPPGPR